MANFLRQKYKEKPQIWGSFESVQRSLFKNAERIGINPKEIALAMPMWNPGNQIDYSKNKHIGINTSASFSNNALQFNGTSSSIEIPNHSSLNFDNNFSVQQNIKITAQNSVSRTFSKFSYFFCDKHTNPLFNAAAGIINSSNTFIDGNSNLTISLNTQRSILCNFKPLILDTYINFKQRAQNNTTINVKQTTNPFTIGCGLSTENLTTKNAFFTGIIYQTNIFKTTLKYAQISPLSYNPYQLWQRQPDIFYSIPVASGGTTYQATCATSWFIRVVNEKQTAWNILNLLSQGSDWKIFKDAALNSSYKILSDTTQESSFKILSDTTQESSYKILHRSIKDSSYMILSKLSQESAWQILLSSLTEQSIAWKILNSEEQETSWQIMLSNILEQAMSWKIFNSETQNSSFNILNSESQNSAFKILNDSNAISKWQISNTEIKNSAYNILNDSNAISAWKISISNDANTTWNILNEKTIDSTWKIKKDNVTDTTWKILNVNDTELAYSIKHILENNSEWKVFNTETINSSWSLLSDIIPSALYEFIQSQRTTEFSQTERTFLFNQAQRTFIFFK